MKRRFAAAALAASITSSSYGEAPSERVCAAFGADVERALAGEPNSLARNNLLFEAARNGCMAPLQRLLQAGASRLARNRDGDTPLGVAARAGRLAAATALLEGGDRLQLNLGDVRGATPLMLAIAAGRSSVARTLIAAGADIGASDRYGETALSVAAYSGDEALAGELLDRGARADAVDRSGKGPICYAAARGMAALVERLIAAGVDPNARYANDLTALMWAAGGSDATAVSKAAQTVKTLVARGAKLDLVDDRGRSALMIAAALGRTENVAALIAVGADPTLRDKEGRTALNLAADDITRELLK